MFQKVINLKVDVFIPLAEERPACFGDIYQIKIFILKIIWRKNIYKNQNNNSLPNVYLVSYLITKLFSKVKQFQCILSMAYS